MDIHEVVDDLVAPSQSGDKKIDNLYKALYVEHVLKGITYAEPMRSKFTGNWRYLLMVRGPKDITIIDLDNNNEYKLTTPCFEYLKDLKQ